MEEAHNGGAGRENQEPSGAHVRHFAPTVLLVDYFFPPQAGAGVQRTLAYTRHLPAFGWQPIVLTAESGSAPLRDPSLLEGVGPHTEVCRAPSIEPIRFVRRSLLTAERNRLERHWKARVPRGALRSLLSTLPDWVLFPDRRVGWLPFAVGAGLRLGRTRKVDVIYSTSTVVTSHLVGYALSRAWGVPWVADFQDPWVEEHVTKFPTGLHRCLARQVERFIVEHAARVTVTTEPLRRTYEHRYGHLDPSRFRTIPMGFEPGMFPVLENVTSDKFVIMHFGSFYGTRSPVPFLEGLRRALEIDGRLRDHVQVRLLGRFELRLREMAQGLVAGSALREVVHFEDPVPYLLGLELMKRSSVLLLVTDDGEYGRSLVPSKLYEYLGAQRPILVLAPDGASAGIVRKARAGVVVAPTDREAIAAAILEFHGRWMSRTHEWPFFDKEIQRYAWDRITFEFSLVLDEVFASSRRSLGRLEGPLLSLRRKVDRLAIRLGHFNSPKPLNSLGQGARRR